MVWCGVVWGGGDGVSRVVCRGVFAGGSNWLEVNVVGCEVCYWRWSDCVRVLVRGKCSVCVRVCLFL